MERIPAHYDPAVKVHYCVHCADILYRTVDRFRTGKGYHWNRCTVAIGLWNMLEKENIYQWYTRFAAGAVCVSIPIAVLFLFMQRCYTDGLTGAVKG